MRVVRIGSCNSRSRGRSAPLIGIVGPCASGKSTLALSLRAAGYAVKEIAQEHSVVPDMWQRLTSPDVLIYLDVDPAEGAARQGLDVIPSWWREEREVRLRHAREHCDVYVDTTGMTPSAVVSRILMALNELGMPCVARRQIDTCDQEV